MDHEDKELNGNYLQNVFQLLIGINVCLIETDLNEDDTVQSSHFAIRIYCDLADKHATKLPRTNDPLIRDIVNPVTPIQRCIFISFISKVIQAGNEN